MSRVGFHKTTVRIALALALSASVNVQRGNLSAPSESPAGLIDGTVLYEDGMPVRGASVYAVPLGRPFSAIIPHADTDEAGRFSIHIFRSWFGKFAIAAKKEDEDYPDMSSQFYSNGRFETVTLSSSHPSATVTIRLGPKAGVLEGKVSDAVTGAPLQPCVELRRAANPDNFMSGSGLIQPSYKLLVPSDTDVLMKVWLDGYLPWYFPGTSQKSAAHAVRLKPGEHQTLDIALQPSMERPKLGCGAPIPTAPQPRTTK